MSDKRTRRKPVSKDMVELKEDHSDADPKSPAPRKQKWRNDASDDSFECGQKNLRVTRTRKEL